MHGVNSVQTLLACCWQVRAQRLAGFQGLPEEGGDHDVPRVVPVLLQVSLLCPSLFCTDRLIAANRRQLVYRTFQVGVVSLGIGTLFFRTTMHQSSIQDGVTYLALIFFTIVSSAAAPLPLCYPLACLPTETSFPFAGAHDVSVFACSPGSPLVWLALS